MALTSISDLLTDQLKDVYNAEHQLLKALPKMAKRASDASLQQAFIEHRGQTEGHVERLERIGEIIGITLKGKKCKAMQGLVEEGAEAIEEEGDDAVVDAALIAAAQRVEHYEMSAYGTMKALANELGRSDVVAILQETLDEEEAADEKLTSIAVGTIYKNAPTDEGDQSEDDSDRKPSPAARKKASSRR